METNNEKKKMPKIVRNLLIAAAAGLLVGIIGGGGLITAQIIISNSTENEVLTDGDKTDETAQSVTETPSEDLEEVSVSATDVSEVASNVIPAIVVINSTMSTTTSDMFGREYEYESTGSGSGIIVSKSGTELLIVTNAHVVNDATKIEITFIDDSTYTAELKGIDVAADIAVVSVPLKNLSSSSLEQIKIATLGNSNTIKTGDMAIAIGNALGYGQSVTVGYISAASREVTIDESTMTLIQTDAAINPGNSGGALLNVNGEVIGINSVKFASDEVEGMGYAIPISTAIPIINELMNREELTEDEAGFLGITGRDVTSSHASWYKMPIGIYVDSVEENSPADDAGIKAGDIITSINGCAVTTKEDLQIFLDSTRAGTAITILVTRLEMNNYIEKEITVTLGNR